MVREGVIRWVRDMKEETLLSIPSDEMEAALFAHMRKVLAVCDEEELATFAITYSGARAQGKIKEHMGNVVFVDLPVKK